jgi:hypothetical protein
LPILGHQLINTLLSRNIPLGSSLHVFGIPRRRALPARLFRINQHATFIGTFLILRWYSADIWPGTERRLDNLMQTIQVLPNPHIYDPLAVFQTKEGEKVLHLFKEGATLKVWRHTTPHNWWLEHADGREYHWDINVKMRAAGTPDVWLLTRLGKLVESEGPLTDSGKPSKESWAFDEAALARAQADWTYAQECVQDWQAHAGAFSGSLANLSPLSQSAVLTLRSKTQIPMRGELFATLLELNAAGLLDVHAEGYATLRIPAKSLNLPKVKPLKIERIRPGSKIAIIGL